jgi:hypothetical protein
MSIIYILIETIHPSACVIVDSIEIIHHYINLAGVEIDVDMYVSIKCLLSRCIGIYSL